jgi:peptide/nickel transport system permease protein
MVVRMTQTGTRVDPTLLENLRHQYGLDQPMYVQYLRWIWNLLHGNLGYAFGFSQPVAWVIGDRVILTASIAISTIIFTYLLAIPIGIYSATHQYTFVDYFFTLVAFIGVSAPSFLLALIMTVIFLRAGLGVGGLFSPDYLRAPWSFARVVDLLKHLPLPMVIIGLADTAWVMRVMRATLLDELGKQYVITARAKGVNEMKLLFKYPVRVALNPIVSSIGGVLPYIISGGVIVELVLNLPTVGPMLYQAIVSQDIYLASSLLLILGMLTTVGTLISDILLVVLDPRIRFTSREA